jgi:hypothetical protein
VTRTAIDRAPPERGDRREVCVREPVLDLTGEGQFPVRRRLAAIMIMVMAYPGSRHVCA